MIQARLQQTAKSHSGGSLARRCGFCWLEHRQVVQVQAGNLFLALRGERFDAHAFWRRFKQQVLWRWW